MLIMMNQLGSAMDNILKVINAELQCAADDVRKQEIDDRWEELMMEKYRYDMEMWALAHDDHFLEGWEDVR